MGISVKELKELIICCSRGKFSNEVAEDLRQRGLHAYGKMLSGTKTA